MSLIDWLIWKWTNAIEDNEHKSSETYFREFISDLETLKQSEKIVSKNSVWCNWCNEYVTIPHTCYSSNG
jgi:hypothetical protein